MVSKIVLILFLASSAAGLGNSFDLRRAPAPGDRARIVADGWAAGPVVLGGIRFPVGDVWTVGGEIRWQKAVGEGLMDQNEFFLGDKIDLGGWNYNFTVHLRF